MFLQQSEILYWENKLDKEFRELNQQNQNRYSGWSKLAVGQRKRYPNFQNALRRALFFIDNHAVIYWIFPETKLYLQVNVFVP